MTTSYHVLMHKGEADAPAGFAAIGARTAYYYQHAFPSRTPSSSPAPTIPSSVGCGCRRSATRRRPAGRGRTDLWLRLAEGVGLDRAEVASCRSHVLRGAAFPPAMPISSWSADAAWWRRWRILADQSSPRPDVPARPRLGGGAVPRIIPEMLAYFRSRVPRARRRRRRPSTSCIPPRDDLRPPGAHCRGRPHPQDRDPARPSFDCAYAAYVEAGLRTGGRPRLEPDFPRALEFLRPHPACMLSAAAREFAALFENRNLPVPIPLWRIREKLTRSQDEQDPGSIGRCPGAEGFGRRSTRRSGLAGLGLPREEESSARGAG